MASPKTRVLISHETKPFAALLPLILATAAIPAQCPTTVTVLPEVAYATLVRHDVVALWHVTGEITVIRLADVFVVGCAPAIGSWPRLAYLNGSTGPPNRGAAVADINHVSDPASMGDVWILRYQDLLTRQITVVQPCLSMSAAVCRARCGELEAIARTAFP